MSQNSKRLAELRKQFGRTAEINIDDIEEDGETVFLPFVFTYKR